MRNKVLIAALSTAVLAASTGAALAASPINVTITPGTAWPGDPPPSYNGWTGGGNWGQESGGNGWLNGVWDGSRLKVDANMGSWAGMSYPLTGQTSAKLSTTNWQWRSFQTTGSNGMQQALPDPNTANKPGMIGQALLSMELNGVGVALTVITDGNDNHWDCNGVDLSDNASDLPNQRASNRYVVKPGYTYNTNDVLIQLIQYDGADQWVWNPTTHLFSATDPSKVHYKVLETYDLAQYDTTFRKTTPFWGVPHISANLQVVGNAVVASIADSTNSNVIWSSGPIQVAPLGGTGVGEQAIWGVGSYAATTGGDGTMGFMGNITLAAPTNLPNDVLLNGSFETGESPWATFNSGGTLQDPAVTDQTGVTVYVPTPPIMCGTQALTRGQGLTPDGSYAGAQQMIQVQPGSSYTFSGYVSGGLSGSATTDGTSNTGLWEVGYVKGPWDPAKLGTTDNVVAWKKSLTVVYPTMFEWEHFAYTFTPDALTSSVSLYVRYKLDGADYTLFSAYFDCLSLAGPTLCHTPWADGNGDHSVDMLDFAMLQLCYNGGGGTTAGQTVNNYACSCFDIGGTAGKVDDADVSQFLNFATGPVVPYLAP